MKKVIIVGAGMAGSEAAWQAAAAGRLFLIEMSAWRPVKCSLFAFKTQTTPVRCPAFSDNSLQTCDCNNGSPCERALPCTGGTFCACLQRSPLLTGFADPPERGGAAILPGLSATAGNNKTGGARVSTSGLGQCCLSGWSVLISLLEF